MIDERLILLLFYLAGVVLWFWITSLTWYYGRERWIGRWRRRLRVALAPLWPLVVVAWLLAGILAMGSGVALEEDRLDRDDEISRFLRDPGPGWRVRGPGMEMFYNNARCTRVPGCRRPVVAMRFSTGEATCAEHYSGPVASKMMEELLADHGNQEAK